MRGTGIEKEAEIHAANPANKTKCMSTNAREKMEKSEDMQCLWLGFLLSPAELAWSQVVK
jgi:hypothetical protein